MNNTNNRLTLNNIPQIQPNENETNTNSQINKNPQQNNVNLVTQTPQVSLINRSTDYPNNTNIVPNTLKRTNIVQSNDNQPPLKKARIANPSNSSANIHFVPFPVYIQPTYIITPSMYIQPVNPSINMNYFSNIYPGPYSQPFNPNISYNPYLPAQITVPIANNNTKTSQHTGNASLDDTFEWLEQQITNQQYTKIETVVLNCLNISNVKSQEKIRLYDYLIIAYNNQGKYNEASEAITKCLQIQSCSNDKKIELYYQLAIAYNMLGYYNEALDAVTLGLKIKSCTNDTKIELLYYQQAIACNMLGKYNEAIDVVNKGLNVKHCPDNDTKIELYYQQAIAYNKLSNYLKAIEAINKGLNVKHCPDNDTKIELYYQQAIAYNKLGFYSQANDAASLGLKIQSSPNNDTIIELYYQQAIACNKLNKYSEAIDAITKGLNIKSCPIDTKIGLYYQQAMAYNMLSQYKEAIDAASLGLKIQSSPNNDTIIELYYQRAIAYNKLGQYSHAIKNNSEGIQIEGGSSDTKALLYGQLATVYEKQENYDLAIQTLNQGLKINNTYDITKAKLYKALSYVYISQLYKTNNENAKSLNHAQALVYIFLALNCLKGKEKYEIYDELLKTLKKFGTFADNLSELVIALADNINKPYPLNYQLPSKEDLGTALKTALNFLLVEMGIVEKLNQDDILQILAPIANNPFKIQSHERSCATFQKLEEYKVNQEYQKMESLAMECLELWKQTITIKEKFHLYHYLVISYLKQYNNTEAALKIIETTEVAGKARLYNEIAIYFNNQGNYSQAIDAITKSLYVKPYPDNDIKIELYYQLAIAYNKLGEYPQAIKSASVGIEIEGSSDTKALLYAQLATTYEKQENYDKAIQTLKQGLIKEYFSDVMKAKLYNTLSCIHISRSEKINNQDDQVQAFVYIFHALNCLKEKKDHEIYSECLQTLKKHGTFAKNLTILISLAKAKNQPLVLKYQSLSKEDLSIAMKLALNLLLDEMGVAKI